MARFWRRTPPPPEEKPTPPPPPPPPAIAWDLRAAVERVGAHVAERTGEVDRELLEARMADLARDWGEPPLDDGTFAVWAAERPDEAWPRIGLAVDVVEGLPPTRNPLYSALSDLATATEVLPLELVGASEVRAEEFARHLAAAFGAAIAGEPPERSEYERKRLDYRRLLEAAEQARGSAEERLENLRRMQAHQDGMRRRGKW